MALSTVVQPERTFWKEDCAAAREALIDWWAGRGLALHVTAPKDQPWADVPPPDPDVDLETYWVNPRYRAQRAMAQMARTYYGGSALPIFYNNIGPGSLGMMLGCGVNYARDTIWYDACITDPENHPPLRFSKRNGWYRKHVAVIKEGLKRSKGRWLVGYPDLIENLDALVQLRGSEETLMDLIERPGWVEAKIAQINQAWFDCYDALLPLLRDEWGGTAFCAFRLWGPGKTAKLQCDFSCMISPDMFRQFVVPALTEQCNWLDNSLYHLDGTQAMPHLASLLEIASLRAIEWTPQAGLPQGGDPMWFDVYKRIKSAGKSVQAVEVKLHEVEPLLDAVGPEGMFIMTQAPNESEARALLKRVGWRGA